MNIVSAYCDWMRIQIHESHQAQVIPFWGEILVLGSFLFATVFCLGVGQVADAITLKWLGIPTGDVIAGVMFLWLFALSIEVQCPRLCPVIIWLSGAVLIFVIGLRLLPQLMPVLEPVQTLFLKLFSV